VRTSQRRGLAEAGHARQIPGPQSQGPRSRAPPDPPAGSSDLAKPTQELLDRNSAEGSLHREPVVERPLCSGRPSARRGRLAAAADSRGGTLSCRTRSRGRCQGCAGGTRGTASPCLRSTQVHNARTSGLMDIVVRPFGCASGGQSVQRGTAAGEPASPRDSSARTSPACASEHFGRTVRSLISAARVRSPTSFATSSG